MKINKNNYHRVLLFFLTAIAVILLIVSFCLPPLGVIEPTALQGVAEIFAFAALSQVVPAIESGKTVRVSKGDTSIEITENN